MTGEEWAAALDELMRTEPVDASTLVSTAFADGISGGVSVAYDRDDDYGRVLVSADHSMAVRYDQQQGWWTALDPATVMPAAN